MHPWRQKEQYDRNKNDPPQCLQTLWQYFPILHIIRIDFNCVGVTRCCNEKFSITSKCTLLKHMKSTWGQWNIAGVFTVSLTSKLNFHQQHHVHADYPSGTELFKTSLSKEKQPFTKQRYYPRVKHSLGFWKIPIFDSVNYTLKNKTEVNRIGVFRQQIVIAFLQTWEK